MRAAQPGSVKYSAAFLEMLLALCHLITGWLSAMWSPRCFERATVSISMRHRLKKTDKRAGIIKHPNSALLCNCYMTIFLGQKKSVTYVFKIYPLGILQKRCFCVLYVHLFWCFSVNSWRYLRRFLIHVLFSQFWSLGEAVFFQCTSFSHEWPPHVFKIRAPNPKCYI